MGLMKSLAGRKPADGERPWVVLVSLPGLEHLGLRPWGAYKTQDDASRTKRRLKKRGLHSKIEVVDSRKPWEAEDLVSGEHDEERARINDASMAMVVQ